MTKNVPSLYGEVYSGSSGKGVEGPSPYKTKQCPHLEETCVPWLHRWAASQLLCDLH